MKSSAIFQLGGAAVLGAAILYAIANLIYFLSGQPTAPTSLGLWVAFAGDTLLLLGLGVVFARQSHQTGIAGLVGYVLLVVATLFFIGSYAVTLGVVAGLFTAEQTAQVPTYAFATAVMPWLWFTGLIVFGIATYRAGVFPKYAGALLVLLGIAFQFNGLPIVAMIFAVLSPVAWGWLGWALLMEGRREGSVQPTFSASVHQ